MKDLPLFIWTINEKDLDFKELESNTFQICNHFQGIAKALTTKQGFCDLLRQFHWVGEDSCTVSPRSYNLGDGVQRDEFIDDFKITTAINLIKLSVRSYLRATDTYSVALDILNINIDNSIIDDAVMACSRFTTFKANGMWRYFTVAG